MSKELRPKLLLAHYGRLKLGERCKRLVKIYAASLVMGLAYTVVSVQAATDGAVVQMRDLLDQGLAAEAYAQGRKLETDYIGEPSFDFYFGLAAVESGHPGVAALAFERVLLAEPGSARVQLELARALFQLGDFDGAQIQFNRVLDTEPPQGVRATINRFLAAIEVQRKRRARQFSWGFALATGHDSNVNSATSADQFDFALGTVTFAQESQKTEDNFAKVSAFFDGQFRLGQRTRWFVNSRLESSINDASSEFNTDVIGASVGYGVNFGASALRVPVSVQAIHLDGEATRYSAGLGFDWSWPIASNAQAVVFAQGNALRNPVSEARDSNLYAMGLGLSYFLPDWRTQFLLSVSLGADHALNNAVFEKHFASVRLGGKVALGARWELSLDLDLQGADYQDKGVFLTEREDTLSAVNLNLAYALGQRWQLQLQAAYTDNQSNLKLYDYDRAKMAVAIEAVW